MKASKKKADDFNSAMAGVILLFGSIASVGFFYSCLGCFLADVDILRQGLSVTLLGVVPARLAYNAVIDT